jgi:hypothetical protein
MGVLLSNRKAVIQVTGGNYKDSPWTGRGTFDLFLENVIRALGDEWATLTVDTEGLDSLVADMWHALWNEQLQNDAQARRDQAEAAGVQWPKRRTDGETDEFWDKIQKRRQEHMTATGAPSASAHMSDRWGLPPLSAF